MGTLITCLGPPTDIGPKHFGAPSRLAPGFSDTTPASGEKASVGPLRGVPDPVTFHPAKRNQNQPKPALGRGGVRDIFQRKCPLTFPFYMIPLSTLCRSGFHLT